MLQIEFCHNEISKRRLWKLWCHDTQEERLLGGKLVKIVFQILFVVDCKGLSSYDIHLSSDFNLCPNRGPERLELDLRAQA